MQKLLSSNKGQMAIFLILIFQVLFVFFAMVVNVGLVVHDKINLQNATDMGAYYGAQKQAELMNEIGHINYQIRQAFKLMTFRLRVPGSVGIGIPNGALEMHPLFTSSPDPGLENQPFFDIPGQGRRPPAVCIGNSLWAEYQATEGSDVVSLCKDLYGFATVPPSGGGGGPLSGLVDSLDDLLKSVAQEIETKCNQVGRLDWELAARFLLAYRLEADRRSKEIDSLSAQLTAPGASMKDFTGNSVYSGVQKTVQRNLTSSQQSNVNVLFQNALSTDIPSNCSDPNYVLPKVEIFPVVNYVYMLFQGGYCYTEVRSSRNSNVPPSASNQMLLSSWQDTNPIPFGVEKNPWCMPYVHVSANSSPRKIFAPFGEPVALKAESYAKPFGGRIGPWYSKTWPSGSPTSVGNDRTDPLLPSRMIGGAPVGNGPEMDVVNHSKYPGDQLGMNSKYALSAMKSIWTSMGASPTTPSPVLALAHYNHVGNPQAFDSDGDSLVRQNGGTVSADNMRKMEEAAIAPDLFDITYYSIDARFRDYYQNPSQPNFLSFVSPSFPDLGSHGFQQSYAVLNQIASAQSVYGGQIFYSVDNPDQLLTGWTQNRAVDYSFPDSDFGHCQTRLGDDNANTPAPGGCAAGGRTGYSVKIVSKDYLKNVSAELGGPGQSGPILNPPSQ